MYDQKLLQQLMATYLVELHEHVSTIGQELLVIEKHSPGEDLTESWTVVFRAAHTLKGASAVVGVQPIRDACHYLEDILGYYRDSNETMPQQRTSTILKVLDAIEEMGNRLRSGEDVADAPLLELVPSLERLANEITVGNVEASPTPQIHDANVSVADVGADEVEKAIDSESETTIQFPEIDERLSQVFLDELHVHAETLSRETLAVENATDPNERKQLLDSLFRAAHSLKGASMAVGLDPVREICHYLEELLTKLRNGTVDVSSNVVSRMLESSDVISAIGLAMREQGSMDASPIQRLLPKLHDLTSKESSVEPHVHQKAPVAKLLQPAAEQPRVPVSKKKKKAKVEPKPVKVSKPSPVVANDETASIRVPARKLDALLSYSGELLLSRGRLSLREKQANELRDAAMEFRSTWQATRAKLAQLQRETTDSSGTRQRALSQLDQTTGELSKLTRKIDALSTGMESDNRLLNQTCSLLDDEIYNARMLPFAQACGGLERAVRDIAATTNKQVELRIEGADVEVDRSVLEGLKDPLLHLVRNGVDHGIETPAIREAAGKNPKATISVTAQLRGGHVEVLVEDDGAGFDLDRICTIAEKRGLDVPDDPREQARLVFAPGFSTAKMITDISGRGVGLDVVQSQVESLHGAVEVSFKAGKGTRFALTVPLTLTTIRAMLVVVNHHIFAIPTSSIRRLVRFGVDEVKTMAGRDALLLRDAPTPLVSLANTLGLKSKGLVTGNSSKGLAIVLSAGEQQVALAVDEVLAEQEVLVKNNGLRVRRLRHFSGCTLLPNGQISLVTNSANVVRTALGLTSRHAHAFAAKRIKQSQKRLLLADDSVTTLALLKSILETCGYDVTTAVDGQEAWELAQSHSFEVLVSDVDMPRMNGFELTSLIRGSERHAELPIILVTARGSDQDKEQGVRVGANAYIVKGSFDQQNLLDTLAQLV